MIHLVHIIAALSKVFLCHLRQMLQTELFASLNIFQLTKFLPGFYGQ